MAMIDDGPWPRGIDSLSDPCYLAQGAYQWSVNTLNKGGIIRTRPGFRAIADTFAGGFARGMTVFTPKGSSLPVLVVVNRNELKFNQYPYNAQEWQTVPDVTVSGFGPVQFETTVKAVEQSEDGNVTAIDPYLILMISNGSGRTIYWDGVNAGYHEDMSCSHMKWIGNRLWIMSGKTIRASNLLDPMSFTEEDVLAEGGFFTLPENGTGFGVTPDFRSLLAFTDFTTTAFQPAILNRSQWQVTPDFQKVIFSSIGCAAPKTIVNQFGLTWWLSHNGLTSLDSALQTYRSSKITFKDKNMSRSIANLSDDISGACAGTFGNYLMLSVPSGDLHNYYTWVLDESVTETLGEAPITAWPSVWTGIRPVQWVSANINGKARCFAYSNDTPSDTDRTVNPLLGHVCPVAWEAFMADSRDVGFVVQLEDYGVMAKNVPCYLETKFMGDSDDYKKFHYAEIDVGGVTDTVNVKVSYCGKRGIYKKVLDTDIVASRNSITDPSDITIPVQFKNWIPQRRILTAVNETLLEDDANPRVEKALINSHDKSFSLLIQWTGQMSILKIRMYLEPEPEQKEGMAAESETTARHLTITGDSVIGGVQDDLSFDIYQQSGYIDPTSPRWFEEQYHSLS